MDSRRATERQIIRESIDGNVITNMKPTIISALGSIPKENHEVRIIHDASRPFHSSLNAYAVPEKCQYTSIDKVCALLKPGGWMAKADLSHAYRSVPVAPSNCCFTGLKWQCTGCSSYTTMYDTKIMFGALQKRPLSLITESVTKMMKRRGYKCVVVYLGDFHIISESHEECLAAFNCLLSLLQSLGFTINWNKVVPPTQQIVFLGVLIDSVRSTLSIPDKRLWELQVALSNWIDKKKATKRQLQRIIGKLNWASKRLHATRPFIRRLIDLVSTVDIPSYHVRLWQAVKEDLRWLRNACDEFNGTVVLLYGSPSPKYKFSSDACM